MNDGLYGTEHWQQPEYPVPMELTLVNDALSLGLRLGEEAAAWLTFAGEDLRLSSINVCYWNKYTDGPPPYWATALYLPITDGTPLQAYTLWPFTARDTVVQGAVFDDDTVLLSLYDVISAAGLSYLRENRSQGVYHFEVGDAVYMLDEKHMTLTPAGGENPVNLIRPAPGSDSFRSEIIDGRWMVDADTVYCTFRSFLDWPIRISIDYGTQTVTIGPADRTD